MLTPTDLLLALMAGAVLAQDPGPGERAEPQVPTRHFALVGALVHTMVDGEPPAVRTVVVEDGRIAAVLTPGAPLPEGAAPIEVGGLHLVPGLIDGHVNHDVEHDALYVARGVTLVRDTGNNVHDVLQERLAGFRDAAPGPSLYIAGPALTAGPEITAATWPLENEKAAREGMPNKFAELAARAVEQGLAPDAFRFDYLYFHPDLELAVWRALVETAHDPLDLTVWGPLPLAAGLADLVAAGQDGLVGLHGLLPPGKTWPQATDEDLRQGVATLAGGSTAVMPLLATTARQLGPPHDLEGRLRRLSPTYEPTWRAFAARVAASAPEDRTMIEAILTLQRRAVHDLWKGGVTLVPGSAAPFELLAPGDALLDELDQWIAAGIPSGEVLRLATSGAARALGIGQERGRIAAGCSADLVVLGIDPREGSLAGFRDPELVVVRGQLLERWDLEERDTALAEAQDAAREHLQRELVIAPPDMPAGALLLSGQTQTEAQGQRLVAEHFAVVDLLDGRTAYGARVVLPATLTRPEYQVHLVQTFKGDKLQSFELTSEPVLDEGASQVVLSWRVEGALVGDSNRMSLRRWHTNALFDTKLADMPVGLVDFSDTLTGLILARHAAAGTPDKPAVLYPIKFESNTWEPVQDQWQVVLLEQTRAVVAQSPHTLTRIVCGVDARGAPLVVQRHEQGAPHQVRVLGVEVHDPAGAPPKGGRVFRPDPPAANGDGEAKRPK